MAYRWNQNLETGNTMIDGQHKQLIQAINDLLEACKEGQGSNKLAQTIDFLNTYTAKHFYDEEVLQAKYNYPDKVNHKTMHEAFKKKVAELSEQLKEQGPNTALIGQVNVSVGDWLIRHITKEDVKVAEHIRTLS